MDSRAFFLAGAFESRSGDGSTNSELWEGRCVSSPELSLSAWPGTKGTYEFPRVEHLLEACDVLRPDLEHDLVLNEIAGLPPPEDSGVHQWRTEEDDLDFPRAAFDLRGCDDDAVDVRELDFEDGLDDIVFFVFRMRR